MKALAQTVIRAAPLRAVSGSSRIELPAGAVISPAQLQAIQNGEAIPGEEAVVENPKSPRLTQTLLLKFDRSPVAILKAWSTKNNPSTPKPKKPVPPSPQTAADKLNGRSAC